VNAAELYSQYGIDNVPTEYLNTVDAWLTANPFHATSSDTAPGALLLLNMPDGSGLYLVPSAPWPVHTRVEARKLGLSKYWTGQPCKHGHASQRYTSSGICCTCNTINTRRNRHSNATTRQLMVPAEHYEAMVSHLATLTNPKE